MILHFIGAWKYPKRLPNVCRLSIERISKGLVKDWQVGTFFGRIFLILTFSDLAG